MIKILLLYTTFSFSQYTLVHDGVTREYYVSYPANPLEPSPIIITLHNYYGSAQFIQDVSEMDDFALPQNIAVVYPEGIDNSWNVGTPWDGNDHDDIGFIDMLIDSVAANFNIDLDRVYACGYSNGGYMAYELSCHLSNKITAFGSICGNFMLNDGETCNQDRKIPIIDFHGTADPYVAYDEAFEGTFSDDGSMLFDANLAYWMGLNELTDIDIEILPDMDQSDNTWVEKYTVSGENTTAEFIHYKVHEGGHQWFGSLLGDGAINDIGNNNHDIHASEELVNIFLNYRLSDFTEPAADVNEDGYIDIIDVIITINFLLANQYNANADFNNDGTIDILDIIGIVSIILA